MLPPLHLHLKWIARGSEYDVYIIENESGIPHVLKLPRSFGWRQLLGHSANQVREDLDLLREHHVPHIDTTVLNCALAFDAGAGIKTARFGIVQPFLDPLRTVMESDLDITSVRQQTLQYLAHSAKLMQHGKAIDLAGFETITHMLRSITCFRPLHMGLYNLHYNTASDTVRLLDTGLLDLVGSNPVVLANWFLALVQTEILWLVLQRTLTPQEMERPAATAVAQALKPTTVRRRLTSMAAQGIFQVSRWLAPAHLRD